MAPRSRDIARTKAAYKFRLFRDPKKRSHYTIDGREFLFGKDKSERRGQIYERDMGMCQISQAKYPHKCPGRVLWFGGEWHHVRTRGRGGDDSIANGVWACRAGHKAAHGREPRLKWIPLGERK